MKLEAKQRLQSALTMNSPEVVELARKMKALKEKLGPGYQNNEELRELVRQMQRYLKQIAADNPNDGGPFNVEVWEQTGKNTPRSKFFKPFSK